ncbi:hypothetical protein HELRODRAFT_112541 [Helobdella robusta]|uniref:RRM domain-containing protein n=1 Tax=Helobdella robusta TaxID=6412 RepID=T1EFK6_HELRO|nr:hypothetical protein HELRODRAFT_112541 [Helobdella robusta]ESO01540.1 hypothetical protein HELRODRAFT_112541 [Helobdella robusta]
MAEERSIRSVFVGNIPYEATEDQLREIFSQAGPVVSFRLVYDRETGKPKGYGFCEYQDTETAQSAMRNLNNYDFHGRPLRVGVAAGDQAKEEGGRGQFLNLLIVFCITFPYGEPVDPEKAPETVSKAVASLPPEQMYELMKQMKLCIQNNPNEARNMLIQNPQLAYGLLQAQIVMKIVDPQLALAMLHRPAEQIPPLVPSKKEENSELSKTTNEYNLNDSKSGNQPRLKGGLLGDMPVQGGRIMGSPFQNEVRNQSLPPPPNRLPPPPQQRTPISHDNLPPFSQHETNRPEVQMTQQQPRLHPDYNARPPRVRPEGRMLDSDIPPRFRGMEGANILPPPPRVGFRGPARGSMDQDVEQRYEHMSRGSGGGSNFQPIHGYPQENRGNEPSVPFRRPSNNHADNMDVDLRGGRHVSAGGKVNTDAMGPTGNNSAGGNASVQDQEKAALIMQVLQLSDEQIATLPHDQRQSILILKEQIARSAVN